MPTRRRTTRRYPRKSKGRRSSARRTYRPRSLPTILPDRYTCRLKYASQFEINPTEGALVGNYAFRANDLYDPDYTSTGHQPMGFDSLCTYWNHFTVIGSRIIVRPQYGGAASSTGTGIWGVMLTANGTECTPSGKCSSIHAMLEQEKGTRWSQAMSGSGNSAFWTRPKKMNFSLKRFFNIKDPIGEDRFICTASASPAEVAYYEVWVLPAATTNDVESQWFIAEIEYIVVCHEPKAQDPS